MKFLFNKEEYMLLGNIYGKYYFHDVSRPLVISFSAAGGSIDPGKPKEEQFPWGYDFLKKQNVNVLSFSPIKGKQNYYRDRAFHSFTPDIADSLPPFPERLGYGASMGGYAASAFSDVLKIDRLLLLNPISSRRKDIASWDYEAGRNLETFKHDWNGLYTDGAATSSSGFIVYDPLFDLDRKHADRYRKLTHLKIPGVGHGIPAHLQQMDMLKWLFLQFLDGDVDLSEFYSRSRKRRELRAYYNWLLSDQNKHITERRRKIIESHQDRIFNYSLSRDDVDCIRDAALAFEGSDISTALKLMRIAKKARPDGPLIDRKVKEYEEKLTELIVEQPEADEPKSTQEAAFIRYLPSMLHSTLRRMPGID